VVERDEQGEWLVSIPDQHLPKVRISDSYYQLYEGNSGDQKEKAYLKEKLASAKFILDAVAQRKRTLLKIVTEIIKHQQAFLDTFGHPPSAHRRAFASRATPSATPSAALSPWPDASGRRPPSPRRGG
jgi:DNA-directed RNA polymerase specialized sigma54-like protein